MSIWAWGGDSPEGMVTADPFPPDLRVVLVGSEPEFRKVPRTFTLVDPVSFVVATSAREAIDALTAGSAQIVVVDLALPEQVVLAVVAQARRARVRHLISVCRRDTPKLRCRAERIDFDVAVFKRRPGDIIAEIVRNTIQYEIRRAPRAVMATVVSFNVDGQTFSGEGVNVASHGVLVFLPREAPSIGSLANMAFDLPGRGHRIIATARIVRSVAHGAGFLTGLQFEAISEADRAQITNYVRRTIEPPDPKRDPLQRTRKASRTSAVGLGLLRASVRNSVSRRRDHFRVRDLSETGAFLYPKPPFEHPYQAGAEVTIVLRASGSSVTVRARVQRVALRGSLEGQFFSMGFAVEFAERLETAAILQLARG